jgi:hypothetical protein
LLRLMREEPALYRTLYHRYGPRQDGWGHMTAAGNAFIAQQIAQRLAARGWLPPQVRDVSVKDTASDGQCAAGCPRADGCSAPKLSSRQAAGQAPTLI